MKRKYFSWLLAPIASMMFLQTSCDDGSERYSTEYRCQFVFNTNTHITSILTRTLDNPGSFALVKMRTEKGIKVLDIQSNNGKDKETIYMTTVEENQMTGSLGANNSIIVGCTNFNGMAAFDGQCPNCLANYTSQNFPLTWCENGQKVSCAKCGKIYELHYEGRTDEGKRLIEYRVRYDGNRLTVTNN